jgi:hypothetical protein
MASPEQVETATNQRRRPAPHHSGGHSLRWPSSGPVVSRHRENVGPTVVAVRAGDVVADAPSAESVQ